MSKCHSCLQSAENITIVRIYSLAYWLLNSQGYKDVVHYIWSWIKYSEAEIPNPFLYASLVITVELNELKEGGEGRFSPSFVNRCLLWKEYQDGLIFLLYRVQSTSNTAWVRENNAALSCKWATTLLWSHTDRNQSPALCLWSCSGFCHFYNPFHVIAYLKKMKFIYWLPLYCLRQASVRDQSYLLLSPCSLRKWKKLYMWVKWGPICTRKEIHYSWLVLLELLPQTVSRKRMSLRYLLEYFITKFGKQILSSGAPMQLRLSPWL